MKLRFAFLLFFFTASLFAQTTFTTVPQFPAETDNITITFDVTNATHANKIAGYFGNVYAHTGVTLVTNNGAPQRWQKVIGNWGDNAVQPQLTYVSPNVWQITINNPKTFYNVTSSSEKITELDFVLRSADGTKQTEDIFVPLYMPGISIVFNKPAVNVSFGDPLRSPVFVSDGGKVDISVTAAEVGTKTKSIKLFVNGIEKVQSATKNLDYTFNANEYSGGKNEVKVVAMDTANAKDSSAFMIMKNPAVKNLPLPAGNQIGINYGSDPTKVTLALYAPQKNFIYVISDLNDWKVDTSFYMNRFEAKPDSVIWWITLSNLSPGQEYAYQFLVDGTIRVQDPYADKILDPWNDKDISSSTYPNLKPYPDGKTENIVSVLQTGQTPYNWKVQNFTRPSKDKLVIYELLVRDFVSTHSYTTLKDTLSYFKKLGVNAIELMPINEFEYNNSWGYNPMMYFAPDKYYGTKDQLKAFIDSCHQNGIAVIMDIVLNHSYGLSPMVRMYWDTTNARPAANNPWFNQQSNFQNPDAQWGYDFNHESKATQYFVDRVLRYWLTEYKMDGFRFDFTKGFGNNIKDKNSDPWGSKYDPDRIRLLKRMVDKVWSYDPTAIITFEHLAENSEETELANYGILLWGNLNYNYNEATMGWLSNSNFSGISYKQRGWNVPNLIGYMESHDEERLMYKNLTYGNSSGSYNIKNLSTALSRIELASVFFFTVPGPKLMWQFGELGYDYSINYPSGTGNDRLTPKPIRWDYFSNADRKNLFNVFAGLIKLKKTYPAFSSKTFSLSASGAVKTLSITDSSMSAMIFGNFDVIVQNATFSSKSISRWYEFFTGDSINVSDVATQIQLQPGEYRLYASKKLPKLDVKKNDVMPTQYSLSQNYPNPFNQSTVISYQLSVSGLVKLKVYDLLGREIAILVNQEQNAGNYKVEFDSNRFHLSSGVYFYRIETDKFVQSKKMVLLK